MHQAHRRRSLRHATLPLVLAALLVGLLPAGPALAAGDLDFQVANACPPGTVPDSGFTDSVGTHRPGIECTAWFDIARGITATTFGRTADIRRDQTATVLVRTLERIADLTLPERKEGAFSDPISRTHRRNVEVLANVDPPIVTGFPDGTFRGARSITRAQFASVLHRAIDEIADQIDGLEPLPPGDTDRFADVDPETSPHAEAIAALADAGIVAGTTATTFDPRAPISRGQVATLAARLLGGLVNDGRVAQPVLVTGVVHDATDARPNEVGVPVDGAGVRLLGDPRVLATSAPDGTYEVWLQQPGDHRLHAAAPGFAGGMAVSLQPDGTATHLTADLRLYKAGTPPSTSTATTSTPLDVTISGGFWRIALRDALGTPFAAHEADQIVHRLPGGTSVELGAAGTTESWWRRNPDGTSAFRAGDHVLYYRFGASWLHLTVSFDGDGRLTAVNGVPYVG